MKCAGKQKGCALKRSRQLWQQLCSALVGVGSRSPIYRVKRDPVSYLWDKPAGLYVLDPAGGFGETVTPLP